MENLANMDEPSKTILSATDCSLLLNIGHRVLFGDFLLSAELKTFSVLTGWGHCILSHHKSVCQDMIVDLIN